MATSTDNPTDAAAIVLPSNDLDASIGFFRDHLGFRLDMIFPADAPREAQMSGYGLTLHLDTACESSPETLSIRTSDPSRLAIESPAVSPDGLSISIESMDAGTLDVPVKPGIHIQSAASPKDWGVGRAGMQYRDLIPDRLGGAWIASHIRIPDGGPVPDYVHHHHVRFQIIFCRRGWVRVVYEDQGAPFVMHEGDCVLQPPHIRHRVLECSDGFEVVEVGSPAEHQTLVDHEMTLPTKSVAPARSFSGQTFVRHQAAEVAWGASEYAGLEMQQTGIGEATNGIGDVRVLRPAGNAESVDLTANHTFLFRFVLDGSLTLESDEGASALEPGAAFVFPPDRRHGVRSLSADCRLLEVIGT